MSDGTKPLSSDTISLLNVSQSVDSLVSPATVVTVEWSYLVLDHQQTPSLPTPIRKQQTGQTRVILYSFKENLICQTTFILYEHLWHAQGYIRSSLMDVLTPTPSFICAMCPKRESCHAWTVNAGRRWLMNEAVEIDIKTNLCFLGDSEDISEIFHVQ